MEPSSHRYALFTPSWLFRIPRVGSRESVAGATLGGSHAPARRLSLLSKTNGDVHDNISIEDENHLRSVRIRWRIEAFRGWQQVGTNLTFSAKRRLQ